MEYEYNSFQSNVSDSVMIHYNTDRISEWCAGQWLGRRTIDSISGFSNDTRRIKPGEMFVALVTDKRDGHDFLADAEERGAVAALVSREVKDSTLPQLLVEDTLSAFQNIAAAWRKDFSGKVVGITGSCGKTSTKDLLASMLGREKTHATEGNLNNHLGVPLTLAGLDSSRHSSAVVELGINQPGEMETLARLVAPDISLFTMIGSAHLEQLGSIENVAKEKSFLGKSVQKDGYVIFPHTCCKYESFNNFDAQSVVLAPEGEAVEAAFQGNVIPYDVTESGEHLNLEMRLKGSTKVFTVPACSPGMLSNVTLAITTALIMNTPSDQIQIALDSWKPSRFRGEEILSGKQTFYVDCYNANPDSFTDAFKSFSKYDAEKPRLYVLGCMNELGSLSDKYHYDTGKELRLRPQDSVIVMGVQAEAFRDGIIEGGANADQVCIAEKLEEVHKAVQDFSGYIMLKGSRTYQLEKVLPEFSGDIFSEGVAC